MKTTWRRRLNRGGLALSLAAASTVVGLATNVTTATADPATGGTTGQGTLTESEIGKLVASMTLLEKSNFVHGGTDPAAECAKATVGCVGQAGYVQGVARLGIPSLRLTDGPAGVRLSYPTTALPAPVGLSATFDRAASKRFGEVMGDEGRATNQDVLLAPMVNLTTVPTAGRNFETLGGEDVFLAGELVEHQVEGIQEKGLIATVKHFVMNDFENSRQQTSVKIDERSFREGELQAFEKAMKAHPGAVMCSYNRIKIDDAQDTYACSNDDLQNGVLRGELGFDGMVMSDWGATHRLSDMPNGLDIQMPNGGIFNLANLTNATTNGTTKTEGTNDLPADRARTAQEWNDAVDSAVTHVLTAMNDVGLLEGTEYGSKFSGDPSPVVPARPTMAGLKDSSFQAAKDIAEESATLLKNDAATLPLKGSDFSGDGVLMVGPTSVTPYIGGGGSANVTPYDDAPSPYGALKSAAPADGKVTYSRGYDLDGSVVPTSVLAPPADSPFVGQTGLVRTQISPTVPAAGTAPAACATACAPDVIEPTVDHTASTGTLAAGTAWRWQGTLTAPSDGDYQLKIFVKNQSSAQLYLDGGLTNADRRINLGPYGVASGGIGGSTVSSWHKLTQTAKSHDPAAGKLHQGTYSVTLKAGEARRIDLRAFANATDDLSVRFAWVTPETKNAAITAAVDAAKTAKKVVVFAYDEGTEGSDRGGNSIADGLKLPGYQDELITALAAVNQNTVVVLNTGDAVLMPWAGSVKSILEMWYPGQRGGTATADVLTGAVNPSGKSPITFPASGTQVPQYDPACTDTAVTGNCSLYPGAAETGFLGVDKHSFRTIDYARNGIFTGYRWYDKANQEPLFPFGHGLSYTTFDYSNLKTVPNADGIRVSFTVKNTGGVAGTEVPQVYVGGDPTADIPMAKRALAGFERVSLGAGKSRTVTLQVDKRQLSYWSAKDDAWTLSPAGRSIEVGTSSRVMKLTKSDAAASVASATLSRGPDANGWYNHPVSVTARVEGLDAGAATCETKTYRGPDSGSVVVPVSCTGGGKTYTAKAELKYDATAPTTKVTTHSSKVSGWKVLRGTASAGKGSPVATVGVKLVQHRSSRWYAWSGKSWKSAKTRTSAWAKAKEVTVTPTSSGRWSTKLADVKKGTVSIRTRATDQAGNRSSVATSTTRIKR
jgi:beta-glucosidase